MKHIKAVALLLFISTFITAQPVNDKLSTALQKLTTDPTLKHAITSMYVVNSRTNEVVFDYNSQLGLAPASCQKVLISIAAFDLLGTSYQYKTELGYDGFIKNGVLFGNLYIKGYGDPTLGSWRYTNTNDTSTISLWLNEISKTGIKKIEGNIVLDGSSFSIQPIPGGWPWEDMGNYYGAGCWGLNWYENQYDLTFKPGLHEGDSTLIVSTKPNLEVAALINKVKTGKLGSGENANIYLSPYSITGFANGTIPPSDKNITIAGATPNPYYQIDKALFNALNAKGISYKVITNSFESIADGLKLGNADTIFYTYKSPTLDSINYWFLKKSVNLYGEALVKTLGYSMSGEGVTEKGLNALKDFWEEKGIERSALHLKDGSGLSPTNRITTNALVNALQYARNRPWFASFYSALPEYNGMKLKSGTIGGVKGFVGYHTSLTGTDYTLALIINNYDGASAEVVKKMYQVLDELK